MSAKKEAEKAMKNPIEWLLHVALMLLVAVIALTFALQLLAQIWMWLVGISLLVVGGVAWYRIASAKRRRW